MPSRLLLIVACLFSSSAWALDLTSVAEPVEGEPFRLVATGAASGDTVVFFGAASTGSGPCPPAGSPCLGLAAPVRRLGSAVADASGRAELDLAIPSGSSGRSFSFQAVRKAATAEVSPVVTSLIAPVPINAGSPVGTNLDGISDWMTQWAFVDVFQSARAWIPQRVSSWEWDTGEPLDLTPEGWVASLAPDQAAGTLFLQSIQGHYPGGQYVVLYEGNGTMDFDWDASVISSEPGRIVLDVAPTNAGIYLKLTSTDPADPVRNIRVLMPGFEHTYDQQIFHLEFLSKLERFKVLRFMNLMNTNHQYGQIVDWDDRARTTDAIQSTDKGIAPEYIAWLANRLHADPWVTIPHTASDDYVQGLATLLRDELEPGRQVYIEHSNEVWNGIFPQAGDSEAAGLALGLSADPYEARLRYHSQRSVEIFAIFESVFGGTERLVRVLASQSANDWTGETIMDWNEAWRHADALAIAPYFCGYGPAGSTTTEILDACEVDLANVALDIADNAADASARGLSLIAYEGGQHLVGADATMEALYLEANRDPRMGTLYTDHLYDWQAAGGELFVSFTFAMEPGWFGSWGVLEYQDQTRAEAPKYDALMTFMETETAWW